MKLDIDEPCSEDWDAMARRGRGRYCDACEKTVLDFSRMTKREAKRALRRREAGPELCGNVAYDARTMKPVFRPEASRARHWAGGLVLVAALTQACGEAESPVETPVAIVDDPDAPCELGPPMEPVAHADPLPATGPVDVEQDAGEATPTAEQAALTEAKHDPPRVIMRRGGIRRRH